jgi:ribosomal protein S18 acetylase RimI-like enzyme
MTVTIRNANIEEGPLLAEIEQICFPAAEAASKEEVLRRIQVFPENFFVAEMDGKVIGFINGGNYDEPNLPDEFYHDITMHNPNGDYQTVFGLNVLPEYRRNGIGEQLVRHYVQAARERGRKGVILTCKQEKIHFYEKCGFCCHGVADSSHGGAVWYDMQQIF